MSKGKREKPSHDSGRRVDRLSLPAMKDNTASDERLRYLALALVGAILLCSPFLRGLFFEPEQRWTLILALAAFLVVWMVKLKEREVSFLGKPLDYLVLAFLILYLVSALKPASLQLAVGEIVKVSLYFLVYWMTSQLGRETKGRYFLIAVLYAAAVGVAAAGILTAQGIIHIKDGFLSGRIYSTLQYPNALASYLTAVSFLGLFLWTRAPRFLRFVLAAGTYLLLVVLLGSGSRGGLILYPVVLILFFVGVPAGSRGPLALHVIGSWIIALLAYRQFLPLLVSGQGTPAWQWLALGMVAALALQGIYEACLGLRLGQRTRLALGALAGIFLVGGGVAYYLQQARRALPTSTVWQAILPQDLLTRLQDINLQTSSAAARLQWSQDALRLIQERPILGYGGGGWEAAYQSIQSYYYTSTQVHNHYFQIWTEVGSIGLAVFLAIWFFFLWTAFRNHRRGSADESLFQWAVLAAALSLGLHAIMDFDLSLSAVALVLWTCFGLTRAMQRDLNHENYFLGRKEYASAAGRYLAIVVVAVLVVALMPCSLLLGSAAARKAVAYANDGKGAEAIKYIHRAGVLDPTNGTYAMQEATLLMKTGKADQALRVAEKAVRKEPFSRPLLWQMGEIYFQTGQMDNAVQTMERAQKASPCLKEAWERLGRAYASAGVIYLLSGDREKAGVLLEQAAGLPLALEAKMAGLSPENLRLWQRADSMLEVTPAMRLAEGVGLYGLGRPRESLLALNGAMDDPSTKAEALYWSGLCHRQLGETQIAEELRQEVEKLDPDLVASYKQMDTIEPL